MEEVETAKALSLVDQLQTNPKDVLDPKAPMELHEEEIEELGGRTWLTGYHINCALSILRNQFPNVAAMYNTHWLDSGFPSIEQNSRKWLQIIHVVKRQHWILVSMGFFDPLTTVFVLDSMDTTGKNKSITPEVLDGIAQILKTPEESFSVTSYGCQQQPDGYNCGVFAIALATSLLFNENISEIEFDVAKMRPHLQECFKEKKLTPFPKLQSNVQYKTRSQRQMRSSNSKEIIKCQVYCVCRMPYHEGRRAKKGKATVECSKCKKWFHKDCEKIPRNATMSVKTRWLCSQCTK